METTVQVTECTCCGANVEMPTNPELNELLSCSDCGTDLEITSLSPFRVEELATEEEDWGQ